MINRKYVCLNKKAIEDFASKTFLLIIISIGGF